MRSTFLISAVSVAVISVAVFYWFSSVDLKESICKNQLHEISILSEDFLVDLKNLKTLPKDFLLWENSFDLLQFSLLNSSSDLSFYQIHRIWCSKEFQTSNSLMILNHLIGNSIYFLKKFLQNDSFVFSAQKHLKSFESIAETTETKSKENVDSTSKYLKNMKESKTKDEETKMMLFECFLGCIDKFQGQMENCESKDYFLGFQKEMFHFVVNYGNKGQNSQSRLELLLVGLKTRLAINSLFQMRAMSNNEKLLEFEKNQFVSELAGCVSMIKGI